MNEIIEQYIRKILEIGYNSNEYDSIVIYSEDDLEYIKKVFLNLKNDYNIDKIIFFGKSYNELYNFFKTNPDKKTIKKYVNNYPKLKNNNRTKFIWICSDSHDGLYLKILDEFEELFDIYNIYDCEINKEYWDLANSTSNLLITCLPNKFWAESLLGSKENLKDLWKLVNQTIPKSSDFKIEIKRMKEIRKYLQMSKIRNLYFYTDLGTDFKISLTRHSVWLSEPEFKNGKEFFYNLPSYEIYTAPNCYSAEGKVVLSRPTNFYGERISKAQLEFSKGRCIKFDSDNENWEAYIKNKNNNLYRIGEIALVSKDSPIAKLNQVFDSLLLDENAGCHLALGDSIRKCIDLPDKLIKKNGSKYYRFNKSEYHNDLVFGNDSITVEADTRGKKKVLLMENGIWKI